MLKIVSAIKNRNVFSYMLHFIFNCILAVTTVSATALTGNAILGLFFVLMSKWRMFAVHPYHWLANISVNLVDLIVGLSFALLALQGAGTTPDFLPVHILLIIAYIVWLTVIKRGSSLKYAETQSLIAVFLGTNMISLLFSSNSMIFILAMFVIFYAAVKHLLLQSEEERVRFLSVLFGLIFAWIAWMMRFWLIAYGFESTGMVVSQISIVMTLMVFAIFRVYMSILKHDGKARTNEILAPVVFSVIIVMVIIFVFSKPIFNI